MICINHTCRNRQRTSPKFSLFFSNGQIKHPHGFSVGRSSAGKKILDTIFESLGEFVSQITCQTFKNKIIPKARPHISFFLFCLQRCKICKKLYGDPGRPKFELLVFIVVSRHIMNNLPGGLKSPPIADILEHPGPCCSASACASSWACPGEGRF